MPLSETQTQRRVLILDQDETWARDVAAWLAPQGYEVIHTASSTKALSALSTFNLPIALADVGGGGHIIAQLIEVWSELALVAVGDVQDGLTVASAFRDGACDFFDKSKGMPELLDILERCFRRQYSLQQGKAQYDELWRAKVAAEAASRSKSQFLSTVSHELRTPLNAIIGFSEVILRQAHGPIGHQSYLDYIKDINNSGRHLLDIINDILDLSKIEAGHLELNEREVSLYDLAEMVVRLLGPKAREAGVDLSHSIDSEVLELWCDERKLKQMLINLIGNAVKFTPAGGSIKLSADYGPGGVIIAVSDTGIGIAEVDLPRVMEPFVQLANPQDQRSGGAGLGLPIVKAMAEIHGGALTIESELGKGTAVRIHFPVQRVITISSGNAPAQSDAERLRGTA